jgi:methenyltetrahydrofolate cyclohydrolase
LADSEITIEILPSLLEKPAALLLKEFGAGNAAPGSGSAGALMGLLSIKLLFTVRSISMKKESVKNQHSTFKFVEEQLLQIEPRLQELFEKDAREFDEVVKLRIARDISDDPTEKANFSRQANDLLETATENAFEITELSLKLIDYGITIFKEGWPSVRGDSGAAIAVAISGATSGIFISNLNLKTLGTRNYSRSNMQKCNRLMDQLQTKQQQVFQCVADINAEALSAVEADLQLPLVFF